MIKKKWQSTSARKDERSGSKKEASSDDADRTFPNRHHANFVHGLNWKLNSRHRSWNSRDWYFSADVAQFLFKNARRQIMFFFTAEEVFLFWWCIKNEQCRSARFFCASSTDVLLRPKLACSHLFGQENISPTRQKNIIHRDWYFSADIAQFLLKKPSLADNVFITAVEVCFRVLVLHKKCTM